MQGFFHIKVFPVEGKGTKNYQNGAISVEHNYKLVHPTAGLLPVLFCLPVYMNGDGKMDTDPSLKQVESNIEELLLSSIEMSRNINRPEVFLMKRLFSNPSDCKQISTLDSSIDFIYESRKSLLSLLKDAYPQINSILKTYDEFSVLITHTLDEEIYDDLNIEVEIFKEPLSKFNSDLSKIRNTTADTVRIAPFLVDCREV